MRCSLLINGNNNDDYYNELEERKKYVQKLIDNSFKRFKKGVDFNFVHKQNMNYYQETYGYDDLSDRPMLGLAEDDSQETADSNDATDFDPAYDEEVNRLLDEVEEDILHENSKSPTRRNLKTENAGYYDYDLKREQYEDSYEDFPDDTHHVGPVPNWYHKMLQKKIKDAKARLENLSNLVCYACSSTGAHVKRMEQDHSAVFCKMDYPRHPPLNKPWTNFWKFNCMIKCKEINKLNHAHTADCETVVLEHVHTGVSTESQNISQNDYPKFVMDAVELFQDFAIDTTKNVPYLDAKEALDTVYERPTWTEMKLRSNYKNELMIIVRGKGVTSLISKLKRYFDSGPGKTSNVVSVFCINQKWSQKKGTFHPFHVTGVFTLRDKVGPISINYEPKINPSFNSVEAIQLGKIIQDYVGLTNKTTLLDIGCNFGVLSLMMSRKCSSVIGLNTMHFVNSEISQAEVLKKFNNIHNVSFVACEPKDVLTKCSSIIRRTATVAVLNLASPYGKSIHVMQALRDLPTVWRVVVYGSFNKEFHRNITVLTSKDELMGDPYLPMQGCIFDKSPSVESAFDIVILFERKSLIIPSIELLAPGPTMNIKVDSQTDQTSDFDSLHSQDVKSMIKLEENFSSKTDCRSKKYSGGKHFMKCGGPLSGFGKFDSPMLPMDKEKKPENPKITEKSPPRENSSPDTEREFECSMLKRTHSVLPVYTETNIKREERIPSDQIPSTSFDRSVQSEETPFDCSVFRNQQNLAQKPYSSLSVQQEIQFDCSTQSPCSFPNLPPPSSSLLPPPLSPPSQLPPSENSMLDSSQIKKENDTGFSSLIIAKVEPTQLYEDKEEGELSPDEDDFSQCPDKSEAVNSNYFIGYSGVNCQNNPHTGTVKSELVDSCEIPHQPGNIKNEPEDVQISSTEEDGLQNVETPIHDPRSLSDSTHSSPVVSSTNFTTMDGFEFSVRANQSFLSFKLEQDALSKQPNTSIQVKTEPRENDNIDTDEEIKVITEGKSTVAQLNDQSKPLEARLRVKTLEEIIKVKSESVDNEDLRTLIEQRKTIQRKLDRERELRSYRERGRSPAANVSRRYRHQLSPISSPPLRKYNRSPSPRRIARSPTARKYDRSPSPYRQRSPNSRRSRRSPLSPTRFRIKRERSPSIRRFRKSPSPNERRLYKRSPPSPIRCKREPHYSPTQVKREPLSADRSIRSSSSTSSHKRETHDRSKSPVKSRHDNRKRRSRSRSPKIKRKRRSLSPISVS